MGALGIGRALVPPMLRQRYSFLETHIDGCAQLDVRLCNHIFRKSPVLRLFGVTTLSRPFRRSRNQRGHGFIL